MITLHLLLILIFLLLHAFFAGIETGVVSIHRLRLYHYVRQGSKSARILEAFVDDFDRLLGTTLVGTNLCVVMNSVLAASLALETGLPGAQATSSFVIAVIVIIFCEYLPKAWFQARPSERCQRFAGILATAAWILRPFAITIIALARILSPGERTFHRPKASISRDDLKVLAHEGEKHGVLSSKERYMIHRVIELSSTHVDRIMIPREQMICIQQDQPLSTLYTIARESGLTRFPVQDASGTFIGIVNVCFVLSTVGPDAEGRIADYVRPPHVISSDTKVDAVLPIMRRARQPLCLVRKTGNIVGLVTTEDILRVIVGKL
jgi:putative hemolysin